MVLLLRVVRGIRTILSEAYDFRERPNHYIFGLGLNESVDNFLCSTLSLACIKLISVRFKIGVGASNHSAEASVATASLSSSDSNSGSVSVVSSSVSPSSLLS